MIKCLAWRAFSCIKRRHGAWKREKEYDGNKEKYKKDSSKQLVEEPVSWRYPHYEQGFPSLCVHLSIYASYLYHDKQKISSRFSLVIMIIQQRDKEGRTFYIYYNFFRPFFTLRDIPCSLCVHFLPFLKEIRDGTKKRLKGQGTLLTFEVKHWELFLTSNHFTIT